MSLHILDTDHLTLFRAGHPEVVAHIAATPAAQIAVAIITVDETANRLVRSASKGARPHEVSLGLRWTLSGRGGTESVHGLAIFPGRHTTLFGLRKQLPRLGKMDLAIAATVLEIGGVLATRNWGDFQQVPGLVLEDWSKP